MEGFWTNKKVLITGHNGFKGSWLSLWLSKLGAEVHGFSLEKDGELNNYSISSIDKVLTSDNAGDIRDFTKIKSIINKIQPEIVLHLAAQALVKDSYLDPIKTFETNILGTANLLESIRSTPSVRVFLNVTSDKCYKNNNEKKLFSEDDPLGGDDPYSSSKACSEIVTNSYKRSFFLETNIGIATARAGNVLGGGDWSKDRLLPDLFRAVNSSQKFFTRYPDAVRPWQHVLEPLKGYLLLCEHLYQDKDRYGSAWNFGPDGQSLKVSEIIKVVNNYLPVDWGVDNSLSANEAQYLQLDNSKAKTLLNWRPKLSIDDSIKMSVDWFKSWKKNDDMHSFTLSQIQFYEDMLTK